MKKVDAVFIGGSAGSLSILLDVLPDLNLTLSFPIVIVLHRKHAVDSKLTDIFSSRTKIPVVEVEEKMRLEKGKIYLVPGDYHILIEADKTFSLDYSEKVNFSRPSIDVAFQAAAEIYKSNLVCLLLSGSSIDGVAGLETVLNGGGDIWIQNPASTNFTFMPEQATKRIKKYRLVEPNKISEHINQLN